MMPRARPGENSRFVLLGWRQRDSPRVERGIRCAAIRLKGSSCEHESPQGEHVVSPNGGG